LLSDHEERVLAYITCRTNETDPIFARRLAAGPRRRHAEVSAVVGGALVLVSCLFMVLPGILIGVALLMLGLWRLPVTNSHRLLSD
jgi:hypothetical protein